MSIIFYILGGIVLAYLGYSMTLPRWDRPRLINEKGGVVLVVAIALLVTGSVI